MNCAMAKRRQQCHQQGWRTSQRLCQSVSHSTPNDYIAHATRFTRHSMLGASLVDGYLASGKKRDWSI